MKKLELTDKKNHRLDVLSSLILWDNNKPFFDQFVTRDKKWNLYNNWLSGQTEKKLQSTFFFFFFSKHFLKPKLQQKEVVVTVWWPAARLIHYSHLNSGKTITSEKHAQQIGETH